MYIAESKFNIDEIVEQCIKYDTMTAYYDAVDREIEYECLVRGVSRPNIPVDESGYVTSIVLERFGVYFALWQICEGYAGSGNGRSADDVYANKAKRYKALYEDSLSNLTKENIEGGDGSEVLPSTSFTKLVPIEY